MGPGRLTPEHKALQLPHTQLLFLQLLKVISLFYKHVGFMSFLNYINEAVLCIYVYLYICMYMHIYIYRRSTDWDYCTWTKTIFGQVQKGKLWPLRPTAKQQGLRTCCLCPQFSGVFWVCSGQSSDVSEPENRKLISRNSILTCINVSIKVYYNSSGQSLELWST